MTASCAFVLVLQRVCNYSKLGLAQESKSYSTIITHVLLFAASFYDFFYYEPPYTHLTLNATRFELIGSQATKL
jgi:site-specific DNA-adenine methylase